MKNKDVIGRQSREVPSPPDTKHMTVYGTETLTKFKCKCCKGTFVLSEQYMSHKGYCCVCWNEDTTKRAKSKGYGKKGYVGKKDLGTLELFLK